MESPRQCFAWAHFPPPLALPEIIARQEQVSASHGFQSPFSPNNNLAAVSTDTFIIDLDCETSLGAKKGEKRKKEGKSVVSKSLHEKTSSRVDGQSNILPTANIQHSLRFLACRAAHSCIVKFVKFETCI